MGREAKWGQWRERELLYHPVVTREKSQAFYRNDPKMRWYFCQLIELIYLTIPTNCARVCKVIIKQTISSLESNYRGVILQYVQMNCCCLWLTIQFNEFSERIQKKKQGEKEDNSLDEINARVPLQIYTRLVRNLTKRMKIQRARERGRGREREA